MTVSGTWSEATPSTHLHQQQWAFICLCVFIHTHYRPPSLLLQVFQLMASLLAPSSDPNHLIGVSIWVTDWPCCSPVSLCNGWLYRQHNGTFINRAPPAPPPFAPSAPTPSCLIVLSPTSSFLHIFTISIICYSCFPCLPPNHHHHQPPPSFRLLGFIHHHPAGACWRRWRCPMREGPWGSMLCLSVHRMSGEKRKPDFLNFIFSRFYMIQYCYSVGNLTCWGIGL